MRIKVETNSIFQPLTVVVMTGHGIAHSQYISNPSENEKIMEIPIRVTSKMAPQADVIVFYLRGQDGSPVYDQLRINIGMKSDNFVSIFNFFQMFNY